MLLLLKGASGDSIFDYHKLGLQSFISLSIMRFVQIILLATVTALVSATPVPGLPNYRELADYLQEPDNAFEGSHEMAQAVYDACVMRYVRVHREEI